MYLSNSQGNEMIAINCFQTFHISLLAVLLSPLTCTLPLIDDMLKRSVPFAQHRLSSDCYLVRSVASYSIISSTMHFPFGKNILSRSCLRFHIANEDFMLIYSKFISSSFLINLIMTLGEL